MGIGIDVGGGNQDYSYLFQGLSGGSLGNLNMLSDYAAIKNGSYGKLLKSYYGNAESTTAASSKKTARTSNVLDQILEEKKYPKVSKEAQEANSNLTAGISSLRSTVATLQNADTYVTTEGGTSAADKVVAAVKNYVSLYNDTVTAAKDSTLTSQTSHVAGMMRSPEANAKKLAEIGITVNRDGTLQLNQDKLKATDISKVQELFTKDDAMSYGATVMARLGFASVSAGSASSKVEESTQQDKAAYDDAAALQKDIEKLTSESLFEKIKDGDGEEKYDIEVLLATVKSFADHYNNMLDAAGRSYNSGVTANLERIKEKTAQNKDALAQFGISVDEKGKMKLDEGAFKKSDMSKLQKFFDEYGSSIGWNLSLVNYYMSTQANASSGYTASGTYNAKDNSSYDVIS